MARNKRSQAVQKSKEVNSRVLEILNNLPPEEKRIIEQSITVHRYEGPIPHPELLKAFDDVVPGAADRILRMAEEEQKHRQKNENRIIIATITRRLLGLVLGVSIIASLIYIAYLLGMDGHESVAISIVTVTIVAIGVIFVLNKTPDKQS